MSSRCEQNGRQPTMPGQPQNLSDFEPHNENLTQTENKKDICRNFIWGTCNKNIQCKFRHDLDFDEMKKVLKFCHDYQNPPGCTREHCTYLHTTKEEESLFFATGQLPRVLAERHANMSATAAETIPQIALYIQESLVGHPPPPPPPPAPVSAPPPPARAPLPAAVTVTRQTPNMLPIQQLLPPPPPPTVPSTVTTPQAQVAMFTAPPPQNSAVYAVAQPPPTVIPKFDASRPPPPISAHSQTKNGSLKRASLKDCDAQPSKYKKIEEEKEAVAHCEQCVQREIRVESLRDKITRLQRDEEHEALAFKQKLLEYQNRKDLLRSLVNQDLYNLIEEYLEHIASNVEFNDVLPQFNQSSSILSDFVVRLSTPLFMKSLEGYIPRVQTFHLVDLGPKVYVGMSAVPKQFLIQLMDCIFGGGRNLESMLSSTLRLDETQLQTLTVPRRTHTAPKSDVLQSFLDILKQSNAPERGSASDFASEILKHASHSSNTNGCHQLVDEMKVNGPMQTAPPPTYQYAGAALAPPPPATPAPAAPAPARMYYPPPYQPTPSVSTPPTSASSSAYASYHAGPSSYASGFYRQQQ